MDYLWWCLSFVWATYLWDTYLKWRQRRTYETVRCVPPEVAGLLDQKTFDKSRLYQLDKSSFSLCHELFKQIEFMIIIALNGIPYAWNTAGRITGYYGYGPDYEIVQSVMFLLLVLFYSSAIDLPWSVYSTFVLEEKHGFNKQTASFYVKDQIKSFILQCVLSTLIASGLIVVIKWGGEYFYVYAWLFLLVVTLVMINVYLDYIAPLFDKYTPLPEGQLRTAIESLAASLKFPLTKLLVVEGSKRSAHSNAYFYGFWKNKKIVLFDTLLEKGMLPSGEETPSEETKEEEDGATDKEGGVATGEEEEEKEKGQEDEGVVEDALSSDEEKSGDGGKPKRKHQGCNLEEVLAVLAHELGHWKLSHTLKNLVVMEVNLFLTLFLFGYYLNKQEVFTSFGFPSSRPTLIGLILVFQLIFIPYNEVFSFLVIQLSRRFEYQADSFAASLHKAAHLCSALTKLYKDNLAFPLADPLYSMFHNHHPTFVERLRALKRIKQE